MKLSKEHFKLENLTQESIKLFIKRYKNNIVLFVQEILLLEPDENQKQILEAIQANDYVTVSSGRGIGKSWTLSMIAIWTIACRAGAKVLVTSNTDAQSKSTLWPPLITMLKDSLISDWFEYTTELIHFKGDKESAFIKRLVWSENNVEAVSGYHAKNMIYLCDEASKYPNVILDNLYASCTESWNKMLLTSNPTRNTGYFYDTREKDTWEFLEIDSRKSKHTDKSKIQELIDTYGEDSDTVRVQVLGKFPRLTSSSILTGEEIAQTFSNVNPTVYDNSSITLGIDVGAGGDDTCFVIRRGPKIEEIISKPTPRKEQIIETARELYAKYAYHTLVFDRGNMAWHYADDFSYVLPKSVDIRGILFGEKPSMHGFRNNRAYIYSRLKDWVQAGGIIGAQHQHIKLQLQATECFYTDKGELQLISKDKIKKEIGKSPDEADAIALSCGYAGDLLYSHFNQTESYKNINAMLMKASSWE